MTAFNIPPKSFLKAMKLPDDQRRKMLEALGAKMMDQLRSDRESLQRAALSVKLVSKNA